MKKILFIILSLFLVGCADLSNTPTKRVEEFLKKYQTLDKDVLNDLEESIEKEYNLTTSQADKYRGIMKKHYQNLKYEIKDDKIDGTKATVTVEITVTNLRKVLDEATRYMNENVNEFYDETGNYSVMMFNDYRLEKLSQADEKIKYTIYINLTKVDDNWQINDLNQVTYDKINGIYNY